jgi:hypothetical protein
MEDREAILREIAKKKVQLVLPGMDAVSVRRNIAYRGDLLMDIYYPDLAAGQRAPVVLLVMGFQDPQSGIRSYGPFTSWAQLIAASGMAAVIHGSDSPVESVATALEYLRAHADSLDLDVHRLGLFTMSGSVPLALSVLMRDGSLACAALLSGYTMDRDGSTVVADTAAQYGFVNACAGKSVDDLPGGVPMFFVRAGRDQFPGVNDSLDAVVVGALARNLPVTLVNHAEGAHGFECDDDSDMSREIVRQLLAFLRFHLKA